MNQVVPSQSRAALREEICRQCGTRLGVSLLACPKCGRLVAILLVSLSGLSAIPAPTLEELGTAAAKR